MKHHRLSTTSVLCLIILKPKIGWKGSDFNEHNYKISKTFIYYVYNIIIIFCQMSQQSMFAIDDTYLTSNLILEKFVLTLLLWHDNKNY